MTREHKLTLIVGFMVLLVVGVLVGDHFSAARSAQVDDQANALAADPAGAMSEAPGLTIAAPPTPGPLAPTAPQQVALGGGVDGVAGPGDGAASMPVELEMRRGAPSGPSGRGLPGFEVVDSDTTPPAVRLDTEPSIFGPGTGPGTGAGAGPGSEPRGPAAPPEGTGPQLPEPSGVLSPPAGPGATRPALPFSKGREQKHPVAAGETLSKLAERYYGERGLWNQLAAYNRERLGERGTLRQGVMLRIPPRDVLLGKARLAEGAIDAPGGAAGSAGSGTAARPERSTGARPSENAKPAVAKPAPAGPRSYTVKKGDTLGRIAAAELGTATRWREILKLNSARLETAEDLREGMVVRLPAK